MNTDLMYIPEPQLEFARGAKHVDPRFGLAEYGPLDLEFDTRPKAIRLGLIGNQTMIDTASSWLTDAAKGLTGARDDLFNLFPDFPGFSSDSPFKCDLVISASDTRRMAPRSKVSSASQEEVHKLVDQLATDVSQAVLDLSSTRKLDVVLVALPIEFLPILEDDTDSAGATAVASLRELIKARSLSARSPVQIILPRTIGLKSNREVPGIPKRSLQDPATRAWNLFIALYYKAGGKPWRLPRRWSDLATCYLGIKFYHAVDKSAVYSSVAQVFDERGHGLIIRGAEATTEKSDKRPFLEYDACASLITECLAQFKAEHGHLPARLVVHKSSQFRESEKAAVADVCRDHRIDFYSPIGISSSTIKLLPSTNYPTLRGISWVYSNTNAIMYTKGSVQYYDTYAGKYIPSPIELRLDSDDHNWAESLSETLALTKMDWNATQFDRKYPVTIQAAYRVGDVLKHLPQDTPIQSNYGYYM